MELIFCFLRRFSSRHYSSYFKNEFLGMYLYSYRSYTHQQFIDTTIKTGIIKSDVSDHFPICFFIPSGKVSAENEIVYIYKRIINDETIEAFTQNLYENNLKDIKSIRNPNDAYSIFLEKFRTMYDKHSLKKIKLKTKHLKSPWITAGIKKSSKRKQRLYTKFLKSRNQKK